MTHQNATVYAEAAIRESHATQGIALALRLDSDGAYRWYTADGKDTEISDSSKTAAISTARLAWRDWSFKLFGVRR